MAASRVVRSQSSASGPGAGTDESGPTSSADEKGGRQHWETRAREARENLAEAQANVAELEQRITDLRTDRGAVSADNALDPFRLQTLQAEIQKATAQLEAARARARAMRAALEAVLDDARKQSVPAGWVREP